MRNHRLMLGGAAALLALMEFVDAFFIEETAFAIVYAVIMGALALSVVRTRKRWPAIGIGVLAALEFVSVLFVYPNAANPPAPWDTALFAVVTAATVAAALVVLFARRPVAA